jgi:hypothetical protein
MPSPKRGGALPRKTGDQSSLICEAPWAATPGPRNWQRSPHRSCARTGREAAPICGPSRARWPGPSRRRRCVRSTVPPTPSRSTRRTPSSRSSSKRFVHLSLVRIPDIPSRRVEAAPAPAVSSTRQVPASNTPCALVTEHSGEHRRLLSRHLARGARCVRDGCGADDPRVRRGVARLL